MPPTKALEMLIPSRKLKPGDWYDLVEARRAVIAPHLDSFTLGKIADVKCLLSQGHYKGLNPCRYLGEEGFSLDTQGIFGYSKQSKQKYQTGQFAFPDSGPHARGHLVHDGHCYVWGLTRKAAWLLAKVNFRGDPGYKDR